MIRRLSLKQWRAYEQLELDLQPGTTFVVAPNGVGKTSLVLALAWGVYGDAAPVEARDCIRAGAEEATVGVSIDLTDGRRLTIERTVRRKGRASFTADVDGEPLTADRFTQLHESEFGIAPQVAAKLTLLTGRGEGAAPATLNLEDHLYRAFGVDNLVANADAAREAAKRAARDVKNTRASDRERLADRAQAEEELASAMRHAEMARRDAEAAKERLEGSARELQAARRFAEREAETRRRETALAETVQAALSAMGLTADAGVQSPDQIVAALDERVAAVRTELDSSRAAETEARGSRAAAEQSLELLSRPRSICPTCLRPLAEHELDHAVEQQRDRHQEAAGRLADVTAEMQAIEDQLSTLRALARELAELTADAGSEVPDVELNVAELEERHARLTRLHEEANRAVGEAEGHVKRLQTAIDEDERAARENDQLVRAYRAEAIAEAAATALEAARDRAIEALIEPVAREVRWRWKQLFSDDGLMLKADGSMVRTLAGQELGWASLSGGEQTWARVVAHLLIVGSSTKLPFAWFDEPLEHLDPKHRLTVAATLASATKFGAPSQLLVTTYEHALAAQLATGWSDAHVVVIRSLDPEGSGPPADIASPPDAPDQSANDAAPDGPTSETVEDRRTA